MLMSLHLMLALIFSKETDASSCFKVEEGSPLMLKVDSLVEDVEGESTIEISPTFYSSSSEDESSVYVS